MADSFSSRGVSIQLIGRLRRLSNIRAEGRAGPGSALRDDRGVSETLSTFLVTYTYVPDMENRRNPYRQDHLTWLKAEADAGRMVLAGATRDPVDTAVLVVRGEDPHQVRRMLLDDPYAKANLITGVTVRPLGLAVGG
jgi:hypothetical protein